MIVSIHIPKTAGSSFRKGLERRFGDRLLADYGDRPLSDSVTDRCRRLRTRLEVFRRRDGLKADYDIVHGHFLASKYSSLKHDAAFCAFFRDPVARALSQYQYWRSNPDPQNRMWGKLHAEGMTIARFASLPRQQRIFALFTAGWPLERFAFVGITEEYELSLDLFSAIFGIDIRRHRINVGTGVEYGAVDGRERREVEAFQRANYCIYDEARRRFEALCLQYL